MKRHEFLAGLHRVVTPRNYLEIGVNDGRSLTLAKVPTIAIDPAPKVKVGLKLDVHLVKDTSDAFFRRKNPIRHLQSGRNPLRNLRRGRPLFDAYRGGTRLDLAFIDGMHLFEFAFRDFINVERFADWTSVVVIDDMLPRSVDEAARKRHTGAWTGDVYKLVEVLREHRPDLTVVQVDTAPTGTVLVLGADPTSTVLKNAYQSIRSQWVVPDPQEVAESVLQRSEAVAPEALLAGGFWAELVTARRRRTPREKGYPALRRAVEEIAARDRSQRVGTR